MKVLESILNIFQREKIEDSELVRRGQNLDKFAKYQAYWIQAKDYLNEAKKNYSKLSKDKKKNLLYHARNAVSITFPTINNVNLEAQLNYGKKIFKKQNKNDDLYKLAIQAEESALGFSTDVNQLQFLKYARNIFLYLGKQDDVERLAQTAIQQSINFKNPVSEFRFLKFAVKTYKKIGDKEKANLLNIRSKSIGSYLTSCLGWNKKPVYTPRS